MAATAPDCPRVSWALGTVVRQMTFGVSMAQTVSSRSRRAISGSGRIWCGNHAHRGEACAGTHAATVRANYEHPAPGVNYGGPRVSSADAPRGRGCERPACLPHGEA
jgi:hypothetical protein